MKLYSTFLDCAKWSLVAERDLAGGTARMQQYTTLLFVAIEGRSVSARHPMPRARRAAPTYPRFQRYPCSDCVRIATSEFDGGVLAAAGKTGFLALLKTTLAGGLGVHGLPVQDRL